MATVMPVEARNSGPQPRRMARHVARVVLALGLCVPAFAVVPAPILIPDLVEDGTWDVHPWLAMALVAVLAPVMVALAGWIAVGAELLEVGPDGKQRDPWRVYPGEWYPRAMDPVLWNAVTTGVDWLRHVPAGADFQASTCVSGYRKTVKTSVELVAGQSEVTGMGAMYLRAVAVYKGMGAWRGPDFGGARARANSINRARAHEGRELITENPWGVQLMMSDPATEGVDGEESDDWAPLEITELADRWQARGDVDAWLEYMPGTPFIADVLNTYARPGLRLTISEHLVVAWTTEEHLQRFELEATAIEVLKLTPIRVPTNFDRRVALRHAIYGRLKTLSVAKNFRDCSSYPAYFAVMLTFLMWVMPIEDLSALSKDISRAMFIALVVTPMVRAAVRRSPESIHEAVAREIHAIADEQGWKYRRSTSQSLALLCAGPLREVRRVAVTPVSEGVERVSGRSCGVMYGDGDRGHWPFLRLSAVKVAYVESSGLWGIEALSSVGQQSVKDLERTGISTDVVDGTLVMWANARNRKVDVASLLQTVMALA